MKEPSLWSFANNHGIQNRTKCASNQSHVANKWLSSMYVDQWPDCFHYYGRNFRNLGGFLPVQSAFNRTTLIVCWFSVLLSMRRKQLYEKRGIIKVGETLFLFYIWACKSQWPSWTLCQEVLSWNPKVVSSCGESETDLRSDIAAADSSAAFEVCEVLDTLPNSQRVSDFEVLFRSPFFAVQYYYDPNNTYQYQRNFEEEVPSSHFLKV